MTSAIRRKFPITAILAMIIGYGPIASDIYLDMMGRNHARYNHWVLILFGALGTAGLLSLDGMPLNEGFNRLAGWVTGVVSAIRGNKRNTDERKTP
jgi:hypothetical protein